MLCLSLTLPVQAFSLNKDIKSKKLPVKKVIFICDGKDDYSLRLIEAIKNEITVKSEKSFRPETGDTVFCGWDQQKAGESLDKFTSGQDIALVVGIGAFTALAVSEKTVLNVPVILAGVYDPEIFNLPEKEGFSGKRNLTYFTAEGLLEKEIEAFQSISPFETLYVLVDKKESSRVSRIREVLNKKGIGVEFVEYGDDPEAVADKLSSSGAEAVYLSRTGNISRAGYEDLISRINDKKIPSFTTLGRVDIQRDVLAGIVPRSVRSLAGKAAGDAVKIFAGQDAGTLPLKYVPEVSLIINAGTARKIGLKLPFDILLDATIVYPLDQARGDSISIYKAVEEARQNNLLFRIKEQEIEKAKDQNLSYWSLFLPQVDYYMDYDIRDTETAKQKGYPKYFYSHGLALNQMIFSDPAIRDVMNSKKEVEIKKLEKKSATLDITEETSRAYLNYLKAKSFLRVEEENLKNLKENKRIAEQRNTEGLGSEDELLRWQSEISKAKSEVIESGTVVAMARIILNQLMNRPQNSELEDQDVGLEMARYYVGAKYMNPFIGSFETLEKFMEFMVGEGIKNSPEMKTLDLSIKQQKQTKNTAARKFVLPEAYLTGDLKKKLEKKYIDGGSHEDDHADWTVGLKLSYPLFEGGDKAFDLDRERAELDRLYFKKELAEQNIELEIRKACYLMYHSYQNISLSHSSMFNASRTLDMITDKYASGTASFTDIIVAQQDKISKERDAVVAVYDFLGNLVRFDRSVSNFYFLDSQSARKEWLDALNGYLAGI